MIGLDQHEVLPSDRKGTDGPLRRIVIHRDVAVAKELPEVLLLVDAITMNAGTEKQVYISRKLITLHG